MTVGKGGERQIGEGMKGWLVGEVVSKEKELGYLDWDIMAVQKNEWISEEQMGMEVQRRDRVCEKRERIICPLRLVVGIGGGEFFSPPLSE